MREKYRTQSRSRSREEDNTQTARADEIGARWLRRLESHWFDANNKWVCVRHQYELQQKCVQMKQLHVFQNLYDIKCEAPVPPPPPPIAFQKPTARLNVFVTNRVLNF